MTRKDFVLIANAVANARHQFDDGTLAQRALDVVARELAVDLRTTNANFDKQRFLDACGVQP